MTSIHLGNHGMLPYVCVQVGRSAGGSGYIIPKLGQVKLSKDARNAFLLKRHLLKVKMCYRC